MTSSKRHDLLLPLTFLLKWFSKTFFNEYNSNYFKVILNPFSILTGLLERVTAPPDPNCTTIQYGPDTSGTLRSLVDEHTSKKR